MNITLVGGNLTGPMVDNGTLLADNDNDTIVPAGQLNGSDVEAAAAAAAGKFMATPEYALTKIDILCLQARNRATVANSRSCSPLPRHSR